jgi:hypothetical protein
LERPKEKQHYDVADIAFRLIHPQTPMLPFGFDRFTQRLKIGMLIEFFNTQIPDMPQSTRDKLRKLCQIPRMSTYAMGALINETVRHMPADHAFVNVGIWHGFTFLSGVLDNADKTCIAVDNFSEYGGPKDAFCARFEQLKSTNHCLYEMDYIKYFEDVHDRPIGFYIYDGNHSYENQLQGLQLAEPYFGENCIILVDDTNYAHVRQANDDFIRTSQHEYEIIFDKPTYCNAHPTFWNGVTMFRKLS